MNMIDHELKFERYSIPVQSEQIGVGSAEDMGSIIDPIFVHDGNRAGHLPVTPNSNQPSSCVGALRHSEPRHHMSQPTTRVNCTFSLGSCSRCNCCSNISNKSDYSNRVSRQLNACESSLLSKNEAEEGQADVVRPSVCSTFHCYTNTPRMEQDRKQTASIAHCNQSSSQKSFKKHQLPSYRLDTLKYFISSLFSKSISKMSYADIFSYSKHFRLGWSISIITSVILYLLVAITCLASPSEASSYGRSKFSSDSYGLWDRSLTLDDQGHFRVEWTASATDIQFRLTARTRGYIGFGLSSHAKMHGADIVVGWVHSGKAYLQDRHGVGNLEPTVDRYQDWTIVSGYENETHTVLHVSRPLNTCDPENDHIISNDTSRLLWAYHPDDPVDPDSPRPRLHYHGDFRRGARSVFLLDRDPSAGSRGGSPYGATLRQDRLEDPVPHTWTLTNPGVEVKSDMDTVYWCKLFRKPLLVQKNHIIKFEPVFSAGNERHVHHMIVSECTSDKPAVRAALEQLADSEGDYCYNSEAMAPLIKACAHVVVAWAVGSQGLTLPPEAGYPLAPNGPAVYLMQVHYDNPDERHFIDFSGIRIHYTHILRSYDAGVLSVGLDPNWKHLIPPRQASFLSSGHCVAECTAKSIPSTGIQVFGAVVQTHLLGRQVKIRHLRHGVELDPIAQDKNYDYNFLEYRLMKTPKTVLPGDHLISECQYSSLEREGITLGGINTRDEMCLSYLYYWPRVPLSLCHSKPSLNTVLQSLGIQELSHDSDIIKIRKPVELAGKTLEWRLVNYDWKFQFEHFQTTTHTGTFNPMCKSREHSILPALDTVDYEYPNITEPWIAEDTTCRRPQWPHPKDSSPHHRRQRPHHRRQHPHSGDAGLQDDSDPSTRSEDSYDGRDLMFDDEINSKPIKRINADPVRKYDAYMPMREDTYDPRTHGINTPSGRDGIYGNSGRTINTRNRTPSENNREEFDAMEQDLEQEVNHNRLPDSFQERTAYKNRGLSASSRVTVPSLAQLTALSLLALCYTYALSRLKPSQR